MIAVAVGVAITLLAVASVMVSAVMIVAIHRQRREYKQRLEGVPQHLRNLQFVAVDQDAVTWEYILTTPPGFPTVDQYLDLGLTAQMLYRSRLRERINLSGMWQAPCTAVATVLLSMLAVQAVEWLPAWLATMGTDSQLQALIAAGKAVGMLLALVILAMVPAVAVGLGRRRKRQAQRLLEQYKQADREPGSRPSTQY